MSDWVAFAGRVAAVEWGRATYTLLPLPPGAAAALAGTRRVEGEMNEHPVNLAIARAPVVEGPFLWTGRSLLDRIGAEPGAAVEVRLRPAPDDAVDLPEEVAALLAAAPLRAAAWDGLTPGRRRGLLHRLATARTAPTRARRLAELGAFLDGAA